MTAPKYDTVHIIWLAAKKDSKQILALSQNFAMSTPANWCRVVRLSERIEISKIGKIILLTAIPPAFDEKRSVDFGLLTTKLEMWTRIQFN